MPKVHLSPGEQFDSKLGVPTSTLGIDRVGSVGRQRPGLRHQTRLLELSYRPIRTIRNDVNADSRGDDSDSEVGLVVTGPRRPAAPGDGSASSSGHAVGRLARKLGLGRDEYGSGGRDSHIGDDRPIFVLGCCHRTGSTLLQRLISSIPDVFIWGESRGETVAILESRARLLQWSAKNVGSRNDIRRLGPMAFMANATPEQQQIDNAYRNLVRELYRYDISGTPTSRWGFKEVRHSAGHLAQLLDLFPGGRAVVINRDLGQVAESVLRMEFDPSVEWEPRWTLEALTLWRENTFEMPSLPSELVLRISYNSLVQNSVETLSRIEQHLGVSAGSIDRNVLKVRVDADGGQSGSAVRPTFTTVPAPVAQFLADEQTTAAVEALTRYW